MAEVCKLALEDGTVFVGESVGATGTCTGEVVFNTAMTGYQEVFTDPSYCGQIVTMTFPLLGNYGVNDADFESSRPHLSGVVLKELSRRPSNFRATSALRDFLLRHNLIGLAGIDTRALTRRIRAHGALRGAISTSVLHEPELVRLARASDAMTGLNLVARVTPHATAEWNASATDAACRIVAIDCGIKHNILRRIAECGCHVITAPAGATAEQIRECSPHGLLIGNGPGDPAAVTDTVRTLRSLLGEYPIFGICLGHQLLALALDARTYKLPFGHHGANVPVRVESTGRVEITSQNHGFAVDAASLERVGARVTHRNLNDGSVEGFEHADHRLTAVQFHPEASPGPHDAAYLFDVFARRAAQRTRSECAEVATA